MAGEMSRREEEMNEQEEEPAPAAVVYGFDAEGFIQGLEELLNNNVAGYSIGLNENGSTIAQAAGTWRSGRRTAARPGHQIRGCSSRA